MRAGRKERGGRGRELVPRGAGQVNGPAKRLVRETEAVSRKVASERGRERYLSNSISLSLTKAKDGESGPRNELWPFWLGRRKQ